jgi:hypothetical protein
MDRVGSVIAPAPVELTIDVTAAAALGEPASIALPVALPDPARLGQPATVCFAKPGGGYGRRYDTDDLPGPAKGSCPVLLAMGFTTSPAHAN